MLQLIVSLLAKYCSKMLDLKLYFEFNGGESVSVAPFKNISSILSQTYSSEGHRIFVYLAKCNTLTAGLQVFLLPRIKNKRVVPIYLSI